MKIKVAGRWVWITGASSGIGAELAKAVAGRGGRLLLSGRREEALRAVAADCEALSKSAGFGGGHEILAFDLLDGEARAAAVVAALGIAGSFALVVPCAGVSQRSRFEELPAEAFDAIMELDFHAPVDLIRRILPSFRTDAASSILLVSSLAGLMGVPLRSAYASAKHALTGFGAVLRAELRERRIAVTTAFPGYVRTGIGRAALGAEGKPKGVEDPNIEGGADPARVASKILEAALAGRPEIRVAVSFEARIGLFLTRRFPGAATRMAMNRARRLERS